MLGREVVLGHQGGFRLPGGVRSRGVFRSPRCF